MNIQVEGWREVNGAEKKKPGRGAKSENTCISRKMMRTQCKLFHNYPELPRALKLLESCIRSFRVCGWQSGDEKATVRLRYKSEGNRRETQKKSKMKRAREK